jgi:adenine-specific DNA-methyltransferase
MIEVIQRQAVFICGERLVQQEVVLLLGERNGSGHTGIRTIQLGGIDDLALYQHTEFLKSELKEMDHSTEKWTQYFLDKKEIEMLRELRENSDLTIASDVIDVDVGIVTGLNDFFVLTERQAKERRLEEYTRRLVSRSGHLQCIFFVDSDWLQNSKNDLPSLLLELPDFPLEKLSEFARIYIASGEAKSLHTGYKCRIRKRWYVVPSIWTPDAFMLRQVHGYPKIIVNEAGATCTDTIHRVRFRNGAKG